MTLRVVTWNLFHGRDRPPDPRLLTWRSRLLRVMERNATHAQVNRELRDEFARVLSRSAWDIALLQEAPPRWCEELATACGAEPQLALTSRNSLAPVRRLAARLNPDLIASAEGGSNLTLVRRARGTIVERRELELRPPGEVERRAMGFARTRLHDGRPVCVANLHASAGRENLARAEEELRLAARRTCEWAGEDPLILGGDLNVRPRDSGIYAELAAGYGLRAPTSPGALDHLLVRGLAIASPPRPWPPEDREVAHGDRSIRLSDHAPVEATFAWNVSRARPGDAGPGPE